MVARERVHEKTVHVEVAINAPTVELYAEAHEKAVHVEVATNAPKAELYSAACVKSAHVEVAYGKIARAAVSLVAVRAVA